MGAAGCASTATSPPSSLDWSPGSRAPWKTATAAWVVRLWQARGARGVMGGWVGVGLDGGLGRCRGPPATPPRRRMVAWYPRLCDPYEGSVRGVVLGWPAGARGRDRGTRNRATGVQGWGLHGVPKCAAAEWFFVVDFLDVWIRVPLTCHHRLRVRGGSAVQTGSSGAGQGAGTGVPVGTRLGQGTKPMPCPRGFPVGAITSGADWR